MQDLTKRNELFFPEDVGAAGTGVAATWMKIDHRVSIGTEGCGTVIRDALDAGSDRYAIPNAGTRCLGFGAEGCGFDLNKAD